MQVLAARCVLKHWSYTLSSTGTILSSALSCSFLLADREQQQHILTPASAEAASAQRHAHHCSVCGTARHIHRRAPTRARKHTYTHIYAHKHAHANTHTNTNACEYTQARTHTYTCTCTNTQTHTHTHKQKGTHAPSQTHGHTHTHAHMHTDKRAQTRTHTHAHTHSHTRTHSYNACVARVMGLAKFSASLATLPPLSWQQRESEEIRLQ